MTKGYRQFIRGELELRQMRNLAYSQNAFARDIGLAPAKLTQILNGTSGLSPERAEDIAERLEMSALESEVFLTWVEIEHARSPLVKKRAQKRIELFYSEPKQYSKLIHTELFKRWWHLAILNLLDKVEPALKSELALRLEIGEEDVEQSLHLLVSLKLAKEKGNGFVKLERNFESTYDVPSRLNREHHRQYLRKASAALEDFPLESREFLSLLFMLDRDRLASIKKELREFLKSINKRYASQHGQGDELYSMMIQLFPISKGISGGKTK